MIVVRFAPFTDSSAQLEISTEGGGSGRKIEEEKDETTKGQTPSNFTRTDDNNSRMSDPETPEISISADGRDCTIDDDGTGSQVSKDGSVCSMGDDWVNLSSSSHPLNASTD